MATNEEISRGEPFRFQLLFTHIETSARLACIEKLTSFEPSLAEIWNFQKAHVV
jgi:hypothetical protein